MRTFGSCDFQASDCHHRPDDLLSNPNETGVLLEQIACQPSAIHYLSLSIKWLSIEWACYPYPYKILDLPFFVPAFESVWDQAEPRFFAFLVCRAGAQTGASELGGPDVPGYDEFPLCRIHRAQSNASMRRHDRWGIT